MKPEQPVFQFDSERYSWRDVLACAEFTGQLQPILATLRAAVAAEEEIRGSGTAIDEASLQNSANELRYQLNLITADETEQWLATRQLTLSDLNDFLFRSACADATRSSAAAARDSRTDVMSLLWPELVFTSRAGPLTITFLNRLAARRLSLSATAVEADEIAAAKSRFCRREEIDDSDFSRYIADSICLQKSIDLQLQLDVYHERCAQIRLSEKELALSLTVARSGLVRAHYE